MFVGLRLNQRGNYACLFCKHPTWKRESAAQAHVVKEHSKERADLLLKKLKEAENKPPRVEYKERVVYKDRPEPEYQDKRIDIYCSNCRVVMTGVRLPSRHSINTTSCSNCALQTLNIVSAIN